jgi:hypothetical protein
MEEATPSPQDEIPLAERLVLPYAALEPRGRRIARFIRWTMLVLAIFAILLAACCILNPLFTETDFQQYLGGGVMGTPAAPISQLDKHDYTQLSDMEVSALRRAYLPEALLYLAMFLLAQWVFLCPRGSWRIRTSQDVPPGRRAALAAGFIGMLLSVGMLATLMELPGWWVRLTTRGGIGTQQHFAVVWIVMLLLWAGWTWVFSVYWRSLERYTALRRAFRWLLAGTVLELLVAVPAHAWIVSSRQEDCYCELGTYTGVAFGCTAALWLFGPGAFLLFLRERRRRDSLI